MTEEDYEKFTTLLDERLGIYTQQEVKNIWDFFIYKYPNVKDKDMGYRWFLFHSARIRIGDGIGIDGDINLYHYLNDDHIDTALKRWVRARNY